MMEVKILRSSPGKFTVYWVANGKPQKQETIKLDFNPLIKKARSQGITGSFVLAHWRIKPKSDRRWGLYDSATDRYIDLNWDEFEANCQTRFLQVYGVKVRGRGRREEDVKPEAVILFFGQLSKSEEGLWTIQDNAH